LEPSFQNPQFLVLKMLNFKNRQNNLLETEVAFW